MTSRYRKCPWGIFTYQGHIIKICSKSHSVLHMISKANASGLQTYLMVIVILRWPPFVYPEQGGWSWGTTQPAVHERLGSLRKVGSPTYAILSRVTRFKNLFVEISIKGKNLQIRRFCHEDLQICALWKLWLDFLQCTKGCQLAVCTSHCLTASLPVNIWCIQLLKWNGSPFWRPLWVKRSWNNQLQVNFRNWVCTSSTWVGSAPVVPSPSRLQLQLHLDFSCCRRFHGNL